MDQASIYTNDKTITQINKDQAELIALIKRQNELLESLQKNIAYSMRKEDDQHNTLSARVVDINMSVSAMVTFMLKWLVASIPVGIIIGGIWMIIMFFAMMVGLQ